MKAACTLGNSKVQAAFNGIRGRFLAAENPKAACTTVNEVQAAF